MSRFLTTRARRVALAALGGLVLTTPLAPLTVSASAAVAPAVDYSFPPPTANAEPDPFYTPPIPIPSGNPGDIIRARPAKAGPPKARSLANAWQVMYLSTNSLGDPNVVTGTIMVPKDADPSKVPLVSFAPGTTGPAFRCTVSRYLNSGSFYEQPAVNEMLEAGYAVAVTDYEGYHENPKTTYVIGKSVGAAVLNVARAASRLPEAGLAAQPKTLVRGYSQGGGAAMWAGQMASTYAPDVNLIGVAAGGVPANLASVALKLQNKPTFGFLLNALIGLDNAYPELLLDTYLNDTGKTTISAMESDDCTVELLLNYQNKSLATYTTVSPFSKTAWLRRISPENLLGQVKFNVPVLQYHGTDDEIVAFDQAKILRDTYCGLGMSVQWKTFPTGHITGVARGNADVMTFLGERLSGAPAAPNCDPPAAP